MDNNRNNKSDNNNKNRNEEPFKITGNWETQAKELKKEYSQLSDSDLKLEAGKEHELLGRVSSRLNMTRDEVIEIIKDLKDTKTPA